jgi:hypothetical protein
MKGKGAVISSAMNGHQALRFRCRFYVILRPDEQSNPTQVLNAGLARWIRAVIEEAPAHEF